MAASRQAETTSVRSSVTEEGLEEARQRLLDHIEVESVNEDPRYQGEIANGHPPHLLVNPAPLPHAMNHTRHWPATYGSVGTGSIVSHNVSRKPSGKRYRIPFLILLMFDWGLAVFFSVVVMQGNYFELNIQQKYFDLVLICTFRVALSIGFYLVLGWVTRIIMALTTIVSALYLPIKAYYSWHKLGDNVSLDSIATLMMLLVTFGMPWFTAFFFEFKYLPAELARLDIPSWRKCDAWVWPQRYVRKERTDDTPSLQDVAEHPPMPNRVPHPRLTASTMSLDFRTPIGSSRASPTAHEHERYGEDELPPIRENDEYSHSSEHHSPECDQTMSPEDLRFKREGMDALESFKSITATNSGWTTEKTDRDLKIYSQVIERKKVWKAEGILQTSARNLFSILYPGDCTPDWNPQCGLNETVYRVDDVTDVLYNLTNPMGPVSSRDFVSIRHVERSGGRYYSASKGIVTTMKPEQPGKVRAENGPCGYLVYPVTSTQCTLVWVLNSNLKGWLPQTVIDQTLSTVLTSSFAKLRTYVATRYPPDQ